MSTIYSDAAGNKYLGDCLWGNHDINYPTTEFLESDCTSLNLAAGLNNLIDASGLIKGSVISQATLDAWTGNTGNVLTSFSPQGDAISNRFQFSKTLWLSNATLSGNVTHSRSVLNNGSTSAAIANEGGLGLMTIPENIYCVGNANSNSMAFIAINSRALTPAGKSTFFFAGTLLDVNTNFDYYNNSPINDVVCFCNNNFGSIDSVVNGAHYIVSASKALLQTDRAAYTIACSDGQTPGSQWATDMWVYDNNAALGYPVIGRVPNMLLGIGVYVYLKPVKIEGSVFPDNGSPWYLPVGGFAGKTLLMRCYSSVS